MATRKYFSEFGINMFADSIVLLQQDKLDTVDMLNIEPHIYLIGRRPRIALDPASVTINKHRIKGKFMKQIKDSSIEIPFDVPNYINSDHLTLSCKYPYTEYAFIDDNSKIVAWGKCALLLSTFGMKYWEHLDLEILYVGQAYGSDGSRTVSDRLRNHSTLQGIYHESIKQNPDQDIWLAVCTFEPLLIASFEGRKEIEKDTTDNEDEEHINKVIEAEITEQQQINFTEAAIIRYFQPPYNKIYKDTFPNPAHSTYSQCYEIDLNMVSVEIQTENIGLRLWSQSISPEWTHYCSFPLHSREERIYMFDLIIKQ